MLPRETVTNLQLGMLLAVVNSLFAYNTLGDSDGKDATDGGARMIAENTLRAACDRIDKILNDDSRWDFRIQESLEAQMLLTYKQAFQFQKAQTLNANLMNTPAFRFRPTICKLIDGSWAAVLGDLTTSDGAIIGRGHCPQAAIDDFNAVFLNGVPPEVQAHADAREQAFESGDPAPPAIVVKKQKRRKKAK